MYVQLHEKHVARVLGLPIESLCVQLYVLGQCFLNSYKGVGSTKCLQGMGEVSSAIPRITLLLKMGRFFSTHQLLVSVSWQVQEGLGNLHRTPMPPNFLHVYTSSQNSVLFFFPHV